MKKECLFLTIEQAVEAVKLDFRSYGAQPMLFCEMLRLLCADELIYQRESEKNGLWVTPPGQPRMRWLEGPALVDFMCRLLARVEPSTEIVAAICRLVFQAPCRPARHPDNGAPCVRIQTDTEDFQCRQCGQCCRSLAYHDGVTVADIERLKARKRDDVLEWVRMTRSSDGRTAFRVWMTPGTNQFAVPCPFLKQGNSSDRWVCGIHEVKPQICRNYPVSRKHALMTGCRGFDTK